MYIFGIFKLRDTTCEIGLESLFKITQTNLLLFCFLKVKHNCPRLIWNKDDSESSLKQICHMIPIF